MLRHWCTWGCRRPTTPWRTSWSPGSTSSIPTTAGDCSPMTRSTRRWRRHLARSVSSVTFFAHLVDYSGNKTLAARDHDGFPPDQWRGGERVVSSFPLVAPAGTPAGAYWVEFGAYTAGGQHLLIDGNQERKLLGPVVISLEATAGGAAAVAELGSRIGLLPPSVTRAG